MMYLYFISCSSSSQDTSEAVYGETQTIPTIEAELLPSDGCTTERPPILFVHGFLAAGDGFDRHMARFAHNGHCLDHLFALDWDNLNQQASKQLLSETIDNILEQTGAAHIDLVGHSAGGTLSASLILEPAENRIRRYIHVGSSPFEEALPIPYLHLTSQADPIAPPTEMENAINIQIENDDHFAVITSAASFTQMYSFLYDVAPSSTEIPSVDAPTLWGKALDFGNNVPTEGTISVYLLDPSTGRPQQDTPLFTQEVGPYGYFGPYLVESTQYYELRLVPRKGPPIHHFFSPFDHNTRALRLRALPEEGIGAQFLSTLPLESEECVSLVNYSAHSGMIVGRDSLLIDGVEQLNEDRANAANNTIALFHTDAQEDQQNGPDPSTFAVLPFLAGTDTYWEPSETQSITVTFNEQSLTVPKYAEGILLTLQ